MSKNQPPKDLVGQKFNLLTVIKYDQYKQSGKQKRHTWVCVCECGNKKSIDESHLKNNKIQSCGCLDKVTGKKNPLYKGYEDISGDVWCQIKRSAETRNLKFNITLEYVWNLFIKQDKKCKLSGLDLNFSKNRKELRTGLNTASLDRIDNNKGYIKGNVQWLHKTINRMKWDLDQNELISLCDSIHYNKYLSNNIRPNWTEYYMNIAKEVATRSHDSQTRHGCVVTNEDNLPLGFGYNAFPRKMKDDTQLPSTRPNKYDYIIHAEINAISNCVIKPNNGIIYITGEPCNNCLMHLWQNGVVKVFYLDAHGTFLWGDEDKEVRKIFVEQSGIELIKVKLEKSL